MRVAFALVGVLLAVAGCGTGTDAVARGGDFQFVSPGGQTKIFYDPPDSRGQVAGLTGESLLEPGQTLSLASLEGKVVVLNVWGSWCGPCRAEADDLQRVADATAGDGVVLLGIDVRDNRDAAADFVRDRGLTWQSIYDPPGRSLLALRGYPRNVVPSTIVLDRQHRVAAVFLQALLTDDLLPVVRRIATEP
ncbi:MAG TPA: TlpA disulfide reductase family protein [Pseudonocardiaceae bacterium]|nr:TlpA disulfide reductase family protein [Pseudonocardiaceae bacterium]